MIHIVINLLEGIKQKTFRDIYTEVSAKDKRIYVLCNNNEQFNEYIENLVLNNQNLDFIKKVSLIDDKSIIPIVSNENNKENWIKLSEEIYNNVDTIDDSLFLTYYNYNEFIKYFKLSNINIVKCQNNRYIIIELNKYFKQNTKCNRDIDFRSILNNTENELNNIDKKGEELSDKVKNILINNNIGNTQKVTEDMIDKNNFTDISNIVLELLKEYSNVFKEIEEVKRLIRDTKKYTDYLSIISNSLIKDDKNKNIINNLINDVDLSYNSLEETMLNEEKLKTQYDRFKGLEIEYNSIINKLQEE